MAFNREKLACYANNARTGVTPAYWKYDNTAGDTVTASGYFEDNRLSTNDIIEVLGANHAETRYYVSAVANGKATVTAVS
jgi:hypothetical protein